MAIRLTPLPHNCPRGLWITPGGSAAAKKGWQKGREMDPPRQMPKSWAAQYAIHCAKICNFWSQLELQFIFFFNKKPENPFQNYDLAKKLLEVQNKFFPRKI